MKNPVLELAHKYIEGLKPGAGDNWTGYCPLHGEEPGRSTPSFSFNASTGQWYCFSEGRGGSLPMFLREVGKNRDSIDLTMQRLDKHLVKVAKKKSPVVKGGLFKTSYPLPERILGLYEACPVGLLDAGFEEPLLWRHDIGYDEERERITFPLRDIDGTLAGIVGRTNNPKQKYKVYRQELIDMGFSRYEISNHDYVWRWDQVYPQCFFSDARPVIPVCEGFKACLWMVQNGYENAVALMGTKISPVQRVFLERLGGTVIWCLDNDWPGRAGTRKNGYKINGMRQIVLNYPEGAKQPDDLEPDELHRAVETSLGLARWARRRS